MTLKTRIIICSDRASSGTYEDKSGPAAEGWVKSKGIINTKTTVIPDNPSVLTELILEDSMSDLDFIIISGGTGIGPSDITPQTLDKICEYEVAGFGEMLRAESLKYSLNSYLSRCGAWVLNRKLIFALPGNPKAVTEQLDILNTLLPHAIDAVQGKCKNRRPVDANND